MNNEIKEILDNIKEDINGKFEWEYIDGYYVEQIKPLLDYITNLQQENKKNKEYIEFYKDMSNKWKDLSDVFNKSCNDYKSRCEKADNQLKIIMQIIKEQPTRNIEDDEWLENRLIAVANILQNGSVEDELK